jgi:hypothetical protein
VDHDLVERERESRFRRVPPAVASYAEHQLSNSLPLHPRRAISKHLCLATWLQRHGTGILLVRADSARLRGVLAAANSMSFTWPLESRSSASRSGGACKVKVAPMLADCQGRYEVGAD